MSANNIAETSTSTGTGNFTLAGAWSQPGTYNTGNRTFSPYYMLNQYFPYKISDMLGNWEKGRGYLSATNTLVRAYVLDNSAGTQDKINFPAGSKIVMVPAEARAFGSDVANSVNWLSSPHSIGYKPNRVMAANVIYYSPFLLLSPMRVKAVGIKVQAQVASTSIRIGIYNVAKQPDTAADYDSFHPLMIDLGTVDSSTTGNKSIVTDINLGEGTYYFATISNGAPTVLGNGDQYIFNAVNIGNSNFMGDHIIMMEQAANAANFTALPAVTFGALTQRSNASCPAIFLKGSAQ